jgi:LPS export ABC transporter protein LptC
LEKEGMIKGLLNTIFIKAALLTGCFFFSGCENDPKVIEQWTSDKVMVEEADSIQSFLSQGSRMRAKLTAPKMLRYQSDTIFVEFPKMLHVDFYDSSGKVESQLNALYGKYFETMNKVQLKDSVVVFNTIGDTLRTPELWWDQNQQKFYTDKKVYIRKSGHVFHGIGMDAMQDLSDIHIRQITGTLMVSDSL